jgi:hypothetical protein
MALETASLNQNLKIFYDMNWRVKCMYTRDIRRNDGITQNPLSSERLDRGFESRSRHGCISAFILCLCCPVQVTALRRADPPPKESY